MKPATPSTAPGNDQLLATAISQHRAGQLAEAERTYRRILASEPGHADCLHLLGIIAHQRGQHDTAVDLIGQAIARGTPLAQYHFNLGLALAALGRAGEAAAQFAAAIAIKSDYVDAQMSFGRALNDQGLKSRR